VTDGLGSGVVPRRLGTSTARAAFSPMLSSMVDPTSSSSRSWAPG
jgi:hypothetical protein